MTERPPAALSSRAALLAKLRTGGVSSAPTMVGSMDPVPLHLGRDDDHASMQRIQLAQAQAQAQAQAYVQNSPHLAQQLAVQQQQQQAELVRLLALQQQQQQLLLLQTLQAQAAQQVQAIQTQAQQQQKQQQHALQTLQMPGLHPGHADSQRHSWAPDTRRAAPASPRFPPRPTSSVGSAGRPISSADLAPSWRSGRRSPPTPPSIIIDDGSATDGAEDMPARRVQQRDPLPLPARMPRGPPTDAAEIATTNFVARAKTKARRDAIKVLAAGRH